MEKLRKVQDISELRVGMITVMKACSLCGKNRCRSMLIKKHTDFMLREDIRDPYFVSVGFDILPPCSNGRVIITEKSVATGRLYLVEDHLADGKAEPVEVRKKQRA